MELLERFGAYAAAFEETYVDDDWSRLEKFFADGATYEVRGKSALRIASHGRDEVLRSLKRSVDGFDRLCDERKLELLEPPRVEGRTVTIHWRGTYTKQGLEKLEVGGVESLSYDSEGKIESMVDTFSEGMEERFSRWAEELRGMSGA